MGNGGISRYQQMLNFPTMFLENDFLFPQDIHPFHQKRFMKESNHSRGRVNYRSRDLLCLQCFNLAFAVTDHSQKVNTDQTGDGHMF